MNNPYKVVDGFVYRRHLLPFNFIEDIFKDYSLDRIIDICADKVIQEAIFIASPDLISQIRKYKGNPTLSEKKKNKLLTSLLKYLIRISSRSTPFGLFAGCCYGSFSNVSSIEMAPIDQFRSSTRLDTQYLFEIFLAAQKNKSIRENLKFQVNSSLYRFGSDWRYIEYTLSGTKRKHRLIGIEGNFLFEKLFNNSRSYISFKELVSLVTEEDYSQEEAVNYIELLIDNQILISELELSLTGEEFLIMLTKVLKRVEKNTLGEMVSEIIVLLDKIDKQTIGIDLACYTAISDKIKSLNIPFDSQYLYQTDLKLKSFNCTLNKILKEQILEGFKVLAKLSSNSKNKKLEEFKNKFYQRYEEREMPLLHVLDTDIGINFIQNGNSSVSDLNPLVDDIDLNLGINNGNEIQINDCSLLLQNKITVANKTNQIEIILTDSDLNNLKYDYHDLPDSMSTMVELYRKDDDMEIFMNNIGGSSGVNLLGRFTASNPDIRKHVESIANTEESLNEGKIIASIVHIPESRTGNILQRSKIRSFEIPFLANSSVESDKVIELDDITISVKYGKYIILKSKKYGKEIIPRLDTAHNYMNRSLPIYEFLCHMQTNNLSNGVGFNWRGLESLYKFLPRVKYKNIILSFAYWSISGDDLKKIVNEKNESLLGNQMSSFLERNNMPDELLLVEGDNELYFDFKNTNSIKLFIEIVRRKKHIRLVELYFSEKRALENTICGSYRSQLVFTLVKDKL